MKKNLVTVFDILMMVVVVDLVLGILERRRRWVIDTSAARAYIVIFVVRDVPENEGSRVLMLLSWH